MPFNPAQFVFQPRPLQQFDFGAGFRDLAEGRMQRTRLAETERSNRATLGENQAQRQDTNSLNAANFARTRSDTEYDKALARYQEREKLIDAARSAAQANDVARADALIPSIIELGGTAKKEGDSYYFEAGAAPTRSPLDIQGARRDIFGGGGPAAGGELFTDQNPFDAPATPGASAAAAGPLPEATPSPAAAAPPPYPGRSGMRPPEGVEVPAEGLTGPNPLNPPTFSPYRINMEEARNRNRGQLAPLLQGIQNAAPATGIDISELNEGALELGMAPGAAFKEAYTPALDSLIKLENGRQAALAAQGRLDQSRTNADTAREDKLRKEAQTKSYRIIQNDDLKKIKTKLNSVKDALSYVDIAVRNPNAANTLVTKMYNANEDGLITNQDFSRTATGWQSIVEALRNHTLNTLLLGPTGINPSMARNMKEVLEYATRNEQRQMRDAADKMYQMYKSASTEGERREYEDGFRLFFPPEYYPPEIAEPWEMDPTEAGAEQADSAPAAGDSLGVSPLPRSLDGGPKVSPNGVPLVPGRIGPKPPRKPPAQAQATQPAKKITEEEVKKKSTAELFQMLETFKQKRGDK